MAAAIEATIPKQLYVTLKPERKGAEHPLGFASPYEPGNKGFLKRQQTQLSWAYCTGYFHSTYLEREWVQENVWKEPLPLKYSFDSATQTAKFYEWVEDSSLPDIVFEQKIWDITPDKITGRRRQEVSPDHPLLPKILDNVPLEGYQLTKEVRRSGWNGGNVVWRILDPRGFELEISSANLARIIDCSCIKEGVITEPCIWGRAGAANVLLPVSSDIYQKAKVNTERVTSKKISLKEVSIGDHVRIVESPKDKDYVYEYLGKFTIVTGSRTFSNNRYYNTGETGINLGYHSYERYIFKRVGEVGQKETTYDFYSTPSVYEIVKKADVVKTKEEVLRALNLLCSTNYFESDKTHSFLDYSSCITGFCIGKVSSATLSLNPIGDNQAYQDIINCSADILDKKFRSAFIYIDNQLHMTAIKKEKVVLVPCSRKDTSINYVTETSKYTGHYCTQYQIPISKDIDFLRYQSNNNWFDLTLNINNNPIPQTLSQFNEILYNG